MNRLKQFRELSRFREVVLLESYTSRVRVVDDYADKQF